MAIRLPRPRWLISILVSFVVASGGIARPDLGRAQESEPALGDRLELVRTLETGPVIDAELAGDHLYAIGGGRLRVFDVEEARRPIEVGSLEGLGNVRQITVRSGVAYVTAREDGLFLVDVSAPSTPRLLSHYDTIELATGIDVAGRIAYVGCRVYGVELVDVTDPRRPSHLSTVRTGEAQSVFVLDSLLVTGVWGSAEMVISDVSDPGRPRILSRSDLRGYGDGVFCRDTLCYVATGHHRPDLPHAEPDDPGYGAGHGMEIFEISDPSDPVRITRVELPRYYEITEDMWSVSVTGSHAFVADTWNGVFVVDVALPSRPRMLAHRQFGPDEDGDPLPVGGLAVGDGVIYAAGVKSDLYVLDAEETARPVDWEKSTPPEPPENVRPAVPDGFRVYRPSGQVHAAQIRDSSAYVAAGTAGLRVVGLGPGLRERAAYPTEGFALDVAVRSDTVFVAEGGGGLSVRAFHSEASPNSLHLLGRYRTEDGPVRQVVAPSGVPYVLLQVGSQYLHVVDVSNPAEPRRVLRDTRFGLLYGNQITEDLLRGRYAAVFWHVSGFWWYDLRGAQGPVFTGDRYPFRVGMDNGMTIWRDTALVTDGRGLLYVGRSVEESPEALRVRPERGNGVRGKPTVRGDTLVTAHRATGLVRLFDLTDPRAPRLIDSYRLAGHPTFVRFFGSRLVVPAGYQGLLVEQ